jgi:hypothetical protein
MFKDVIDELEGRQIECHCKFLPLDLTEWPPTFRIEMKFCPVHQAALDLLKVARPMADIVDFILLATPQMPAERKRAMEKLAADARAAIAKAEGRNA